MKQMGTVFRFEYCQWLKNRSFRVTTIIFLLVIIIAACAPSVISFFSGEKSSSGESSLPVVAISDTSGAYTASLKSNQGNSELYESILSSINAGYQFKAVTDSQDELRQKVENGEYKAALVAVSPNQMLLFHTEHGFESFSFQQSIQSALDTAYHSYLFQQQGLTQEQVAQTLESGVLVQDISVNSNGGDFARTFILAYAMLLLLFICIVMYGQLICMAVAGEKSTHTMEVLITSAKPTHLIFGKVFAASCAGLTQLALFGSVGFIAIEANKKFYGSLFEVVKPFISQLTSSLPYFFLFFLLGFFTYSFLFAAIGSIVSRVEDLNSVMMPIMIPLMISFFLGIYMLDNPGTIIGTIFSFIPLFSPFVMFVRIAMSDVGTVQIALSVIINCLTILASGIISAKIYKRGVLMYGSNTGLKKLFHRKA